MKRQVRFEETGDDYRFSLVGDDKIAFTISKKTLTFSADKFYAVFFKGLEEKPNYEVLRGEDELRGQAKHIYDTVAAIFEKTCSSIDESWFEKQDTACEQNEEDLTETEF